MKKGSFFLPGVMWAKILGRCYNDFAISRKVLSPWRTRIAIASGGVYIEKILGHCNPIAQNLKPKPL